ncbi:MAG: cytidylate kinase-like family protein [Gemmatimonadota bacterium]|nr:cytidylate kinase-like family protein [Gemmatimonadota bacterium]
MALITVSRMYGSGGSEVAERIATQLRWRLFDNSFIDAQAERLGIAPAEVEANEERSPTLVRRLVQAITLSAPEWAPPAGDAPRPPSEERLVEVSTRIINEAVATGPAVLVGRGAQAVLATRSDVIHVLCYAPHPALVARVAARLGVSLKEAERITDDTNREREEYVRKHWKRAWLAHENYHLSLNTDWLGLDAAAALVVSLARDRFRLAAGP